MTCLLLLVLCKEGFSFAGGGDYDLCRAVSLQAKTPVAILSEPQRVWPKRDVRYENAADLGSAVRRVLQLEGTKAPTFGLSARSWPSGLYGRRAIRSYVDGFQGARAEVSSQGGKITCRTEHGPVALSEVFRVGLSRRVTWHWFYSEARLAVFAEGAKEEDYMKAIAGALGAKLVITADVYDYQFDPARYRARGMALLADLETWAPPIYGYKADYAFTSAVLSWLTDDQIAAVFREGPDFPGTVFPGVPASLQILARNRLEAWFHIKGGVGPLGDGFVQAWDYAKDKVDWSRPCDVRFGPSGLASCRYHGRPGVIAAWNF